MSKFLNETGLKHFWDKAKEYFENLLNAFADNVVIKNEDISIIKSDSNTTLTLTDHSISLTPEYGPAFSVKKEENKDVKMVLGNIEMEADGNIGIIGEGDHGAALESSFTSLGFGVSSTSYGETSSVNISADEGIVISKGEDEKNTVNISAGEGVSIGNNALLKEGELRLSENSRNGQFSVMWDSSEDDMQLTLGTSTDNIIMHSNGAYGGTIEANALVIHHSDSNHILLGDGSTATINAAGGIPKLNAQGKLDASMVDIDNTLFEVVAALPTTGIKQNRIYLVPSDKKESNNTYIEYIYTGNVAAAYDASKWEKLGEYTADIDLTPYAKKENTVTGVGISSVDKDSITLTVGKGDDDEEYQTIDAATTTQAGVMSAADKRFIDIFSARYPLKISSLTATPSLLEVGASSDINFAWGYENSDLHTPDAVQIKTLEGDNVAVNKSATSYKESGVTGATTAATKTATLTVTSGDKTVTRSVNLTYHYPSYIGVVANGATIDEAAVKALTKSVEWGKGKTAALTQANQKIVYAYPASYGDLTSIKDGNGFQGFAGYTKQTVNVNGQAYNVYVQNLPATSSSTYTFA